MSLNLELMCRVDRELSNEIELTVRMQTRIRRRLAVADPAELEELRSVDRELSTKIEFAIAALEISSITYTPSNCLKRYSVNELTGKITFSP
jgi:hypothetical protein